MSEQQFDAVVVGGSLAGCTAAILLARRGIQVALLERHGDPLAYKHLCTHFIQPSAWPILRQLGLDRLIEEAGGVRNPIEMHTPAGWIGALLEQQGADRRVHGYNIRRLRLDPILRRLTAETAGVTMMPGRSAERLIEHEGRIVGVLANDGVRLHGKLVVAADGRNSDLARLAGVVPKRAPNHRFGIVAPMRKVALRRGHHSQMWLTGADAAYAFPNDDNVTVLVWMGQKDQLDGIRDAPLAALKQRLSTLPDSPGLDEAELDGDVLVMKDYPNLSRPPVVRGMALAGDAAVSVDPLWGVGCGWAFQMGGWLADATAAELLAGRYPAAGLAAYGKCLARLNGHRFLITDFSRRKAFNPIERLMFSAAAKDPEMALHTNRFGARLVGPATFLSPAALLKAIWVNLRHRTVSPGGTRGELASVSSLG